MLQNKEAASERTVPLWVGCICDFVVALVAFAVIAMYYAIYFLKENYGDVPWGQLLYHIHTPLQGTNVFSFKQQIILAIIVAIVCLIVFGILGFFLERKKRKQGYYLWMGTFFLCMFAGNLLWANQIFHIEEWYRYAKEKTQLYENEYVDARDVEIVFPEIKRNLIYIFLESMETSWADKKNGGAIDGVNLIPELTELAQDNICFSGSEKINGTYILNGTEFTMGALVAHTSGVPINENIISNDDLMGVWESENNYLPGVWTIGDILAEEGYVQEFLCGSNAKFAGRSSYFKGHGNYTIFDFLSAKEYGKIADDYKVWWGFEDAKLFEYAKESLEMLASSDQPFNMTILTVDTHFPDGYVCQYCEDAYELQYSNVFACASRQISSFLSWVAQQEFYDNTTIVLVGDHTTMDSKYALQTIENGYDRKGYCAIINPATESVQTDVDRMYSSLDLFPTTLCAMGITIEGNKLGLGVNLFSDEATLVEKYGLDVLNTELIKDSALYKTKLLYGK